MTWQSSLLTWPSNSSAMGDADPKASPAARTERVVTRARRSVEKATTLLRGINGAEVGDDY